MTKFMKILEITNYTKGGCGVGMRVLGEAKLLAERGHNITIFSTNREKGSEMVCPSYEEEEGVVIRRFSAVKLGGDSYMHWDFTKEAIKLNPDIIIAHAYRHLHTTQALKIARKLCCKIFLVTHAPFGRESSRTSLQNLIVRSYDILFRKKLNKFDKIITITRWEQKYLKALSVKEHKIEYIPNGVPDEFFKQIYPIKKLSKVIYVGRIAPIKQLQTVILACKELYTELEIIGPAEQSYLKELRKLVEEKKMKNVKKIDKRYTRKEQIEWLDSSGIFILPSKSEGMPQTLVEAMARGKIVIGSDNEGNKELIKDSKNGFVFKNGSAEDLANCLNKVSSLTKKQLDLISSKARKTAEQFRWSNIIKKLEITISR